jgi:hypothetical protein
MPMSSTTCFLTVRRAMRGEVWGQALSLAMAVVLTACGEPSETFQDAAPLQHAEPGAATLEEPETPVLDDD